MSFDVPYNDFQFGRYEWNGEGWSFFRDPDGPVLIQPIRIAAALGDPFAECCRQDWIEKYHHLLAMPVHRQDVQSVCAGSDIAGDKIDPLDLAFNMPGYRSLQQHVSFPALQVAARVGGTHSLSPFDQVDWGAAA